jgi:hypothetical protein
VARHGLEVRLRVLRNLRSYVDLHYVQVMGQLQDE